MSKHYFPSVLDDFEKQSELAEQSVVPTPQLTEGVSETVHQIDPKYKYILLLDSLYYKYC